MGFYFILFWWTFKLSQNPKFFILKANEFLCLFYLITFHAKMGSIKDRNGMDQTEAEDIKKRWQEYTELYKKDLHDWGNQDGVTTHLKSDTLECEFKWPLGRITTNKATGGDGIPAE